MHAQECRLAPRANYHEGHQGMVLQEDIKGRYGFSLVLAVLEMNFMVINNSKNRDNLGAASTFYLVSSLSLHVGRIGHQCNSVARVGKTAL